jgi:CheY-like chemotaxis protein
VATILIIEDSEDLRIVLRHFFEGAGYRVLEAVDGEAGLDVWRNAAVDVVITDLIMPRVDGFQVITRILAERPRAKILAVSGAGVRGTMSPLDEARRLGAVATFQKPFELHDLLRAVRDVLAAPASQA